MLTNKAIHPTINISLKSIFNLSFRHYCQFLRLAVNTDQIEKKQGSPNKGTTKLGYLQSALGKSFYYLKLDYDVVIAIII